MIYNVYIVLSLSFQGPFVMVDRLMEVFAKMQLPDNFYGEPIYRSIVYLGLCQYLSIRFKFMMDSTF